MVLAVEPQMPDVADDSYHLHPWKRILSLSMFDPLPNRICAGEQQPRHCLVDHCDVLRIGPVVVVKFPAANKLNTHGLEIARRHDFFLDVKRVALRTLRLTVDRYPIDHQTRNREIRGKT